ncbi:hypothetical protein B0T26DRAFT_750643 [Lasiosphaeria miniovina]|uniref:Uncharacterized protein n=1 Tax=Lasiosphaeria miniovina TaxID=1954250 RepID=A0AA40AWN7_9PEZI|nr:uncharacterized protein B0T26DRAFT_750643 [Lasiosphaeria miniovina]KAK0723368.1 hypothetical protein B0T26DRAFT_750643 [Lasiosphaeria miniovina]
MSSIPSRDDNGTKPPFPFFPGLNHLKRNWSDLVEGNIEQFPIDSGILTTRNIYPQSAADAPDWLPSPQDIGPLIAHVKNIIPPAERIHRRDSDHFTRPHQLTDSVRKHLSPIPRSALNWHHHLATCAQAVRKHAEPYSDASAAYQRELDYSNTIEEYLAAGEEDALGTWWKWRAELMIEIGDFLGCVITHYETERIDSNTMLLVG